MKYREMTAEQRKAEFEKVSAEFEAWKAKGLKLNMARGSLISRWRSRWACLSVC